MIQDDSEHPLRDGLSQAEPDASALRASIPDAGVFYRTCKNCAFDKTVCARRAEIKAGIKGLSLTTIKFRCKQREPFFRVGQRVGVTWKFALPDWGYDYGLSEEEWPATVVAETPRGFRIVVDDVSSDHETPARDYIKSASLYCNVTASRLRALNEPDRPVCTYCGSAENGDGTVTGCYALQNGCDGMFGVKDCLAKAIEAGTVETERLDGDSHESAARKGLPEETP